MSRTEHRLSHTPFAPWYDRHGWKISMRKTRPDFQRCMWMMRRHNAQTQEDGFHALLPFAGEFLDELIAEYQSEHDHGLRCWLLELIGEAKSPRAFEVLRETLGSDDGAFASWAAISLMKLGTKEARRAVWVAAGDARERPRADEDRRRELMRIYEQYGETKEAARR